VGHDAEVADMGDVGMDFVFGHGYAEAGLGQCLSLCQARVNDQGPRPR
jgi:hypothetical protein